MSETQECMQMLMHANVQTMVFTNDGWLVYKILQNYITELLTTTDEVLICTITTSWNCSIS